MLDIQSLLAESKNLSDNQMLLAAQTTQVAVTGEDPERANWEAYEPDELREIFKLRLGQLLKKDGVTVTIDASNETQPVTIQVDESVTGVSKSGKVGGKQPKPKKVPQQKFAENARVQFSPTEGETITGVVTVADHSTENGWTYVIAGDNEKEYEGVAEANLKKAPKEKAAKPEKPARKYVEKPARFKDGIQVLVEGSEEPVTVVSSTWDELNNERMYVVQAGGEDGEQSEVAGAKLSRYKAPKSEEVKAPRQRRISDDYIQRVRYLRSTDEKKWSYHKLSMFLFRRLGIEVTGDLVRSIIIREIYQDVPDAEFADETGE